MNLICWSRPPDAGGSALHRRGALEVRTRSPHPSGSEALLSFSHDTRPAQPGQMALHTHKRFVPKWPGGWSVFTEIEPICRHNNQTE